MAVKSLNSLTNYHSDGSSEDVKVAQDIRMLLWATYDPNDDLIYPTISHWDLMLLKVMAEDRYDSLSKDEILSMLFGLLHRNRIVDGLWVSMFERGVTQKLLQQLLLVDTR